jgi:hypothetical protein
MLLSRAARLSSKSNGEELALVPYADLMNHNPYSNTYIDAQKSGMPLISRTEEVAVYSDRSYKKFEQVFINYGEKGITYLHTHLTLLTHSPNLTHSLKVMVIYYYYMVLH